MPRVALLDGDHGERAGLATIDKSPNSLYFRNSCFFQLLPKGGGAERNRKITGWWFQRWRPQHDRIISVVDPFHYHDGRLADILLGEITRPFPEGTLLGHFLVFHGRKFAFENNFRIRRNRQTGHGTPYHGDR